MPTLDSLPNNPYITGSPIKRQEIFFGHGGHFDGFRRFLVIDEPTLQGIADMTGGTYDRTENASQLLDVFLNLPTQLVLFYRKKSLNLASHLPYSERYWSRSQ